MRQSYEERCVKAIYQHMRQTYLHNHTSMRAHKNTHTDSIPETKKAGKETAERGDERGDERGEVTGQER